MKRTSLLIVLAFLIPVLTTSFMNCSQPGGIAINTTPPADNNDGAGQPNPGTGTGDDPTIPDIPNLGQRFASIEISGDVTTLDKKVKLLLVVDTSKSMRNVIEKLTQSILPLLDLLSDHNVEVKVITTTEVNRLRDGEALESQGWSFKAWGLVSKPSGEMARLLGATSDEEYGIYSYAESHFLNDRNRFSFQANDANRATKIESLKATILSLLNQGGGSNREQGLCNLLLALHDRGPHQFFEKNDTAGVLVISDENDQSFWNNFDTSENRVACRNMYIHGALVNPKSTEEIKSDYLNFSTYTARYSVTYDYNNDGVIEKRSRGDNGGNPLSIKYADYVKDFPVGGSLACPVEFFNQVVMPYQQAINPPGASNIVVSNCRITVSGGPMYDFAPDEENVCEGSFTKKGKVYNSFSEYVAVELRAILVPGSCTHGPYVKKPKRVFNLFYIQGSEDPETLRELLPKAAQLPSIKKAILNQADRLFGAENFFMTNIVHKDSQCIADPKEQSVGADYMNLFAGTPFSQRSASASICSQSFDVTLQDLAGQISATFNRTYFVTMSGVEIIKSVTLVSGSESRKLTVLEYAVMGNRITLMPQLQIQNGDILKVEIVSVE